MRILLINSNLKGDLFAAPPIGLCYVASAAERAGHEVRVLDLCFKRNVRSELDRAVRDFSAELIGISIRNMDNANMLYPVSYIPSVAEICRHIRKRTQAPIVLGGSGASLSPEGVLRTLAADYIVVSDGEQAFVDLLAAIEHGHSPDEIPGVGFLKDGRFHLTARRLIGFDSGGANVGKWIDMRPYRKMGSSYNVQTKRGCNHQCIYCTYNQVLEGSKLRLRSAADVVDEVEEAVLNYRPDLIEFVDSVFNDPLDHSIGILEEICRRPWKAKFTAMGISPRGLDDEFLALLARAGFVSLWISPESASETMIRSYRKGFSADEVIKAAEAINRSPFTTIWNFLIGGPGETNDTLQETLDFTTKYMRRVTTPPYNMANYFFGVRLYPNTRVWQIAERERFVNDASDPLKQLWYISEELDLDRAVEQIIDATLVCPEIFSGFDEKYLYMSRAVAFFAELLGMEKPYWGIMCRFHRLLLRTGINRVVPRPDIASKLRKQLALQGYEGRLLSSSAAPSL